MQDKPQGYARSDVEKYRKSYLVLGRPKGDITLSVFAACVRRLGIPARQDQVEELFTKYDKKGTGKIGFYELVRQILPQDYPTNSWSSMRGDEILDSEMEKLARSKKGSMKDRYKPNMSIVRPQRTSRGSTAPVQPTPRTARGGRPVSRAMAAHLNSIERMKTARGKGKLSTVKESARRAKK